MKFICFYLHIFISLLINAFGAPPKILLLSFDGLFLESLKSDSGSFFDHLISSGFISSSISTNGVESEHHGHTQLVTGHVGSKKNVTGFTCSEFVKRNQFYKYEPLWYTNHRHGFDSASFFWPGSLKSYKGETVVNSFSPFGDNIDVNFVIKRLIQLFSKSSVSLTTLFIPAEGSLKTRLDTANQLLERLLSYANAPWAANLTILVTGGIRAQRPPIALTYFAGDVLNTKGKTWPYIRFTNSLELWTTPGDKELLEADIEEKHVDIQLCDVHNSSKTKQLPSVLSPPLLLVARGKWTICPGRQADADTNEAQSAFLLVSGAGVRNLPSGVAKPNLALVDVYPLVCWLLGLTKPAPNDGSLEVWLPLLTAPPNKEQLLEFNRYATGELSATTVGLKELFARLSPKTVFFSGIIIAFAGIIAGSFCCCAPLCNRLAQRRHNPRRNRANRLSDSRGFKLRRLNGSAEDRSFLLANDTSPNDETRQAASPDADFGGPDDEAIIYQKNGVRLIGDEEFMGMLHGPLPSGASRTAIPSTGVAP